MSTTNNIDASGNTIDASGNILDASGNIIDNSNNILIEGFESLFSILQEEKTLHINYYLKYEESSNSYEKKLDIEIKKQNDLVDISSVLIIIPGEINKEKTFENKEQDFILTDISKITIDVDHSKYLNNLQLVPGRWKVGISEYYNSDPSFNLKDQKSFFIPMRDFLYNNKKLDFFREQVDRQKLYANITKEELLNLRNNNKFFFNSLGKQQNDNSYLKVFFEFIGWFPQNERSISNSENSWELPSDYKGKIDNRIQFSPTYYNNEENYILSKNLSSFNEPGFRYTNKTLSKKTFFTNFVAKIQKLDPNDTSIVLKEFDTISEHYYLIQKEKNNLFSNLKFKSLNEIYQNINNWIAEVYIPSDVIIKNTFELHSTTKLLDCSGVYSYSVRESGNNSLTLGLVGTGELVEGSTAEETNANKEKSYIFKDKNNVTYQARLSDYNIVYDPINKSYNGGFAIKYIFRERKVGLNIYIDVFIFINNIYFTRILDGGVKLNSINYWGYYGNNNNDQINSMTFLYQSIKDQVLIDDDYSIKDVITWKKYIPTLESDILLSDFRTDGQETVFLSEYPRYITFNGESTTINSNNEFVLVLDMGLGNNVYLEIEDFKFTYRIDNINADKLYIELSNDLTTWVKPGDSGIPSKEWMYKEITRPNIIGYIMPNTRLEQTNEIYNNIVFPIKINHWKDTDNNNYYDISQNSHLIFDTSDNSIKYILVKKLALALNQVNNLGYDTVMINYSNNNIDWIDPEIDWCYKNNISIEIPEAILKLDNTTKKLNTDLPYGYNVGDNYPIRFTDSGGIGDTSVYNYSNSENYQYFFDAGENETISLLIKQLRIENNNDQLTIFGADTLTLNGNNEASYNWTPLQVWFFKTSSNYITETSYNGHYFPFSKISINTFLNNNIIDDVTLNTGYRYIKIAFTSNSDNVYNGWDFIIYKTNQYLELNGNILPKTINIPNNKVITTNYRYIKISFKSDSLYTDEGFELEIYKKDDYTNYKYGNVLPESVEKTKELTNIDNFNELNSVIYNYRYVKFKYLRSVSDLFNDTNKWKIRVDNQSKTFNNISLNIVEDENQEFIQDKFLLNYPIKFNPNKLTNLDYPIATKYSYVFDAGLNNTINLEFNSFDISHNTDINNILNPTTLEKDGFLLINNKFTVSYSNDKINWVPASVPWMHKTNSYIGNTRGGRRVANYSEYYDEENRLFTTSNVVSWYDDTDGFLLPSNETKAKEIYINKYDDIIDISWNKINKVYTNYRYVKFILYFETSNDKYNNIDWDIDIHINYNSGNDTGIIPNINSINSFERKNCIHSLNYEIFAQDLNLDLFNSSTKYIKNSNEIPYICRYDYKLKDLSNNILLESNIDTDIFDDIFSASSNYNSRREGKEYNLIPQSTTDPNNLVNINQKYYYTSKFFSDRILENTLYIPELGEYKFFTVSKKIVLTIPQQIINEIKENIVLFWRGNEYPTYFDLVLYIWYPWTEKYNKYTNSYTSVQNDLRYMLNEESCDEVKRITINPGVYYNNNIVGAPNNNVFEFEITEFSGRYIFAWTYEIKQANGLFDNYTPAKYFYDFDYNNMYLPKIEILNIIDFVSDDFLYDPQSPELTYIENYYDSYQDLSYNKIKVNLSTSELTNFNNFLDKHNKSLESINCKFKNIKVKFYAWTPNNEKSNNQDGWELPSDYYGLNDPRINTTPHYFENKPTTIISEIWDPNYINEEGLRIFGYSIDSSGAIIKEFSFANKINFIKTDLEFDISFSSIYISENDNYFTDYLNNKDIPNPYLYEKNGIKGVPYLSRWEYIIEEDITFKNSSLVSESDILLTSNYDVALDTILYTGRYPISFFDEGGETDVYGLSTEREIVFDAGLDKTMCIEVLDFIFNHNLEDINNIVLKDRLALLVSDDNTNFEPVAIKWMFKSGLYGGDNSGNLIGSSYLNSNSESDAGFILPANKLIALKKYYNRDDITSDQSFNEIKLIDFKKRYLKFRFISASDSVLNNDGWNIKVFSRDISENVISSRIIYQEGGIGNITTDFNYKFSLNENVYLELDKTIKQENPGILDYKDLINTGVSLGFLKGYNFYIINNSNVIWQFVIKKPPTDYVFDLLDSNGNKIGETQKTLSDGTVLDENYVELTYENNIEDNTVISGVNMSFNETLGSNFVDSGRKYILYIRNSTISEREYFRKFKKGRITQIETNEIKNRITDWYPFESRYNLSNNKYNYGTLFNTTKVDIEDADDRIIVDNIIDQCGRCRTITKTKESSNQKQRYSNAVKINFTLASRTRDKICK